MLSSAPCPELASRSGTTTGKGGDQRVGETGNRSPPRKIPRGATTAGYQSNSYGRSCSGTESERAGAQSPGFARKADVARKPCAPFQQCERGKRCFAALNSFPNSGTTSTDAPAPS